MTSRPVLISSPPISVQLRYLAQDANFQRDARILCSLSDADIETALAACSSDGFVDPGSVRERLSEVSKNDDVRFALANSIENLTQLFYESGLSIDSFHRLLLRVMNAELTDEGFTEAEVTTLAAKLATLATPTAGLKRFFKAQRLSKAIGKELVDFSIVTDMRPVFDESRERIEGFVLVNTAEISLSEHNDDAIVLNLDEADLERISSEALSALKKLRAAKLTAAKVNLPIADLGGTDE